MQVVVEATGWSDSATNDLLRLIGDRWQLYRLLSYTMEKHSLRLEVTV